MTKSFQRVGKNVTVYAIGYQRTGRILLAKFRWICLVAEAIGVEAEAELVSESDLKFTASETDALVILPFYVVQNDNNECRPTWWVILQYPYFLSLIANLFELTLFLSNTVFSGPTSIHLCPKVALHFLSARIATAHLSCWVYHILALLHLRNKFCPYSADIQCFFGCRPMHIVSTTSPAFSMANEFGR